jgi:hypothetical protein
MRLYVELKIYDKNRRKITGPQCVKMYLKIWDERGGLNESGSGYREVVGCCECSNVHLVSINFLNR